MKLQKPILAAIACWEIAAFSGHSDYAALAGLGAFLVFWCLHFFRANKHPAAMDASDDTPPHDDPPVADDILLSDDTSYW